MRPAVKRVPGPHQNVRRGSEPPEEAVRVLRKPVSWLLCMMHHHHEVIVAVRADFPPRLRAKQVDPLRLERLDQFAEIYTFFSGPDCPALKKKVSVLITSSDAQEGSVNKQ